MEWFIIIMLPISHKQLTVRFVNYYMEEEFIMIMNNNILFIDFLLLLINNFVLNMLNTIQSWIFIQ